MMKTRKSLILLAAAVLLSPLASSCLKDQADIFEKPSSTRMQEFLENVRTVLKEADKGWMLSYYPGSTSPTCYIGVEFTDQEVVAYSQGAPEEGVKSTYVLSTNDGAVLSFDTYNTAIHYYATPDASHYQARGGDFDFDIMNVGEDRIVLRGKRSRNYCYLDRLKVSATEFLEEINEAQNDFDIVSFRGEITGGLVEGFLDGVSNTLSIGRKGAETAEMTTARYMIVPGGIHINEPFTFQGVEFQDFTYDKEAGTFTGSGLTFQKVVPEGFVPYRDYLGDWTFNYDGGSFPVEIVAFEEGSSFKIKGLSEYFEPVIGYNAARGYLTWLVQAIGSAGAIDIMLCAWDSTAGYLTWNTEDPVGLDGFVEDNTVENLKVNWEYNGVWGSYSNDSWLIWGLSGGSSAGAYSDWSFATGNYQLPGPLSMVKIAE
ncbi:MAG: DUF4302 domain-containing protein [Bacteroidales bacterium]|nr:DUF4302 domain-containing protein [Bacteroidales bacterium]